MTDLQFNILKILNDQLMGQKFYDHNQFYTGFKPNIIYVVNNKLVVNTYPFEKYIQVKIEANPVKMLNHFYEYLKYNYDLTYFKGIRLKYERLDLDALTPEIEILK